MAEEPQGHGWSDLCGFDPYGHFWWPSDARGSPGTEGTLFAGDVFKSANVDLIKFLLGDEKPVAGGSGSVSTLREFWEAVFGRGDWVAMPERIMNRDWKVSFRGDGWLPVEFIEALPSDLPEDTIIVGVIDTGVPLHHHRTMMRTKAGLKTRILGSWQQSASVDRRLGYDYRYLLPFGDALTASDIDRLIDTHAMSGSARLDEDAFKRDANLVDPNHVLGHRNLDFRASHGAHVLDLLAGMDPFDTEAGLLKRVRFIVVNLPPQFLYGTAGNFLQFYASFALQWIADVAQALWDKNKHRYGRPSPDASEETSRNPEHVRDYHYPIAVNLAFGMQAGPKDGNLPFEFLAREIIRGRRFRAGRLGIDTEYVDQDALDNECRETADDLKQRGPVKKIPFVRLSMPVGNSNLDRHSARMELKRGVSQELEWQILPQDQTSNFVEIWSDPVPNVDGDKLSADEFRIHLVLPCGAKFETGVPEDGKYLAIGVPHGSYDGFAHVYCQVFNFERKKPNFAWKRIRFLIALRPTLNIYDPCDRRPTAPAGLWRIGITSRVRSIALDLNVQSDQSRLVHSGTGLSSYFDHPSYRLFDEMGRLKDSFAYDPITGDTSYLEVGEGPVRRVGTLNAMSSTPYATTIAGYRQTDGKPADYSATGYLDPDRVRELRRANVAFPTDDGAAHGGVIGAGSSDGSTALFRGTSMGSALSTRRLIDALIDRQHPIYGNSGFGRAWFGRQAEVFETRRPDAYGPTAHAKTGRGRLPYPEGYRRERIDRLGRD